MDEKEVHRAATAARQGHRIMKPIPGLSLLLLALGFATPAFAGSSGVFRVKHDALPGGDGLTWETAFDNLSEAIGMAAKAEVSEIWVARGTYRTPLGPANTAFFVHGGLALYGGFVGTESSLAQRDWTNNVTVLSGDRFGDDLPGFMFVSDNSWRVVVATGGDMTAVVDGFTISGGVNSEGGASSYGGGIAAQSGNMIVRHCVVEWNRTRHGSGAFVRSSAAVQFIGCLFQNNTVGSTGAGSGGAVLLEAEAAVIFRDCIVRAITSGNGGAIHASPGATLVMEGVRIEQCTTSFDAGGLYATSADVEIRDCVFEGNTAKIGAGLYLSGCSGVIETTTIVGNTASISGGGIYLDGSSPMFRRCHIIENEAVDAGGGLWIPVPGLPAFFENCVFSGNTAGNKGGGVYLGGNQSPVFSLCTFHANHAGNGGAFYLDPGSPQIWNSIVWGNTPNTWAGASQVVFSALWSLVEGGAVGLGILTSDPQFRDPIGPDGIPGTLDDDLRLSSTSPCIDAGHSALPTIIMPCLDLAGRPRVCDDLNTPDTGSGPQPIVDMGAYEFQAGGPADLNCDGLVNAADLGALLGAWGLCGDCCVADFNGDGEVGAADLGILLGSWSS